MKKEILAYVIASLLGVLFLFSAYAKLFPVELFEYTFVDLGILPWSLSPFVARLFIGFEWLLGSLLLLNITGKNNFVLKITLVFLLLLTLYLLTIFLIRGNEANCGCFGELWELSTLESIAKNIVLITSVLILLAVHPGNLFKKFLLPIQVILILNSFALPFILNPFTPGGEPSVNKLEKGFPLEIAPLQNPNHPFPLTKDITKGKWLVGFFSLTCQHCKIAAYKISIIHQKNPEIPIYFILNGKVADFNSFREYAKMGDIPYSYMTTKEGFLKNSGVAVPALLLVNNGFVERRVPYLNLSQEELENYTLKTNH